MFAASVENFTGAVVSALLWDLRHNGAPLGLFPEVKVDVDRDQDFCVSLHAGLASSQEMLVPRFDAAEYCLRFMRGEDQPGGFVTEVQGLVIELEEICGNRQRVA